MNFRNNTNFGRQIRITAELAGSAEKSQEAKGFAADLRWWTLIKLREDQSLR